jgi:endonuclease/exonuclease/phosphatase family metal-dependent hydrolase
MNAPFFPPPALTLASYNIHKGVGTDMRRDPARTVQVIAELRADIIALQEADRRFGDRKAVLDLQHLAELTGLQPVALGGRLGAQASGWHGNLLLVGASVLVEQARTLSLPGLEPRGAIVADLRVGDMPLRIIAAHLGLLRQSRRAQAERLAQEVGSADGRAVLVMGDFNEWRLGRDCGLMPLRRGLRAVKASGKSVASFPAQRPLLPLDRIIGCRQAGLEGLRVHDSRLARQASDHLPICATLRLPQAAQAAI